MRKIIVSMMVTLDGYFAGPDGEIDWHNVDAEFNDFAVDQLNHADTLIFGRLTYRMMAAYWPSLAALRDDPAVAAKMNSLEKLVFSRTLPAVEWNNSRLARAGLPEEIAALKKGSGKDALIFGSGSIVSALAAAGLIDEYRLFVNPVVLGAGRTLFGDVGKRMEMKLLESRSFSSGNVLLRYIQ